MKYITNINLIKKLNIKNCEKILEGGIEFFFPTLRFQEVRFYAN